MHGSKLNTRNIYHKHMNKGVESHQLSELQELIQQENFTILTCHPAEESILLTTCLRPELTSEGPVSPAISFNEAPLSFNEAALALVREEDEEDASK